MNNDDKDLFKEIEVTAARLESCLNEARACGLLRDGGSLKITIGPAVGFWDRVAYLVVLLTTTLAIPVVNVFFLSDHWAIHLVGAFLGIAIGAAVIPTFGARTRRFKNPDRAAAWVMSREWQE